MKPKQLSCILLLLAISITINSCKKDIYLSSCSGHCTSIDFVGIVYDKATNQPISNARVNIDLNPPGYCWLCPTYHVASDNCGSDGRFIFHTEFDSTLLIDHSIEVYTGIPGSYIIEPEPVGPGLQSDNTTCVKIFSGADTIAMKSIELDLYTKALLSMRLHRTTATVPGYAYLELDLGFDDKKSIWGLDFTSTNQDTTLTIYTAVNMYTKVVSSKFIAPHQVATHTDSIQCKPNANNVIDIYY